MDFSGKREITQKKFRKKIYYIDWINNFINCTFKLVVKSFDSLASLPRKVSAPQLLLQKEINFGIKKCYSVTEKLNELNKVLKIMINARCFRITLHLQTN